jgi:alpha-glucoside transport system permease protein
MVTYPQDPTQMEEKPVGIAALLAVGAGRILALVFVPALTFVVLWRGFIFLRDSDAPQLLIVIVAIIWGVGGVATLYWVSNWMVEKLPDRYRGRIQPFVFVGPGLAILIWYLAVPVVRTFIFSLENRDGTAFVGLENYKWAFTDPGMLNTFRNNLLWMLVGTIGAVGFGLLVATLADRSRFERTAKALIFLPMAISFVGAGVIWNFIYEVKEPGAPQIGLLNAIVQGLGGTPQGWTAFNQPWNNLFLIIIVVWLQTGFAMVLISAAIKAVPTDQIEAARVDGATEWQNFWKITIPSIRGTLITVTTTIVIFTLKIFDVVIVMTGGQFGTDVIATQFYRQYFINRSFGRGSAAAVVLLIAVIPVMIYNLRQLRGQETFR